jgi:SAM-dependent methyltransferase
MADAELSAFLAESPLDRPHIQAFVARAADALPAGAVVLDAGAGTAPYRNLFAHVEYRTSDWAGSLHAAALNVDIVAPLEALPVDAETFDAVICTQVLEHVRDPLAALSEVHRVLRIHGSIWLTVPLVWELHEEPYDFYRYTAYGVRSLLERAGFGRIEVEPYGGMFSVVGQLLRNFGSITGVTRESAPGRRALARALFSCGPALRRLDGFDRRRGLPLGYAATATRT